MLVLSRAKNEAILIGQSVRVLVTSIRGDRVKLGVEAPGSVSIHREEIHQSIVRDGGKKHVSKLCVVPADVKDGDTFMWVGDGLVWGNGDLIEVPHD